MLRNISGRSDGFTLVEIIVVLVILSVLAGIAIPLYSHARQNANKSSAVQDASAIGTNIATLMYNSPTWTSGSITFSNGGSGINVPITLTVDGKSQAAVANVSPDSVASGFIGANWWCIQVNDQGQIAVVDSSGSTRSDGAQCTSSGVVGP